MLQVKNIPKKLNTPYIQERLLQICQENGIVLFGIFGSFARGKDTQKSDVDVLIKFTEDGKKSLLDLMRIEDELSVLFQKKVDLLTIEGVSPYLKNEILNTMQTLYEAR